MRYKNFIIFQFHFLHSLLAAMHIKRNRRRSGKLFELKTFQWHIAVGQEKLKQFVEGERNRWSEAKRHFKFSENVVQCSMWKNEKTWTISPFWC